MNALPALTLESLWFDLDRREELLRDIVAERLDRSPPQASDDHVIASYFFAFRTQSLAGAVKEIAYHATSGIKHPPAGSLLEACTATPAGVDAFDATGRLGLLHVAFPLKMMLHPDGLLTSTDVLHTTAAAILFDVYENQDARLVRLTIPDRVLRGFPGPAHGPEGLRELTGFGPDEPAFGTILKPTAGITAQDVGRIVSEVAGSPLLLFIKEDEDLYPDLDYSPVRDRAKAAAAAIERVSSERGGKKLVFAPHVTAAPHQLRDLALAAIEAGATGLMLSETFAGGAVRMIREATKHLPVPPAIYGHNAGIGTRTRAIWREVLDLLARLDGIDFRQTAPRKPGAPFLRPYGAEWRASETALIQPLPGIRPTMITRAGALDQGNLILNLQEVESRGMTKNVLFLAGSAINSIERNGKADPRYGLEAIAQTIDVHKSGVMKDVSAEDHLRLLAETARGRNLAALLEALRQRYPGKVS
jgi:ribulose 1,5-bisphosphate carboxylase large subunit-like protein